MESKNQPNEPLSELSLLRDFPASSHEEWKKEAEALLKGAPFDKKMLTQTYEGITLQPIYRQEDTKDLPHMQSLPGFAPFVRGTEVLGNRLSPWQVCQELPYATPEEFNAAARHDLGRGLTSLNMVLDGATRRGLDPASARDGQVGVDGLSLSTAHDCKRALEGIEAGETPLFVQAGTSALAVTALLAAGGVDAAKLAGTVGMDPLGELAVDGTLPAALDSLYDEMATLARWAGEKAPHLRTVLVRAEHWNHAGGNALQDLAFAVATGVEYLRALLGRGLTIDQAAAQIRFSFAVGSQFFMEIAKLRAARMVWAKVVKAFGGSDDAQKMRIHVRTSSYNVTAFDPWVNMLRTTTEAFSAVVGGCDSLHAGTYDEAIRVPDEFARRIARNTQIILSEEAHLSRIVDPVGGSWYVESLTAEMAGRAWALFQDVEKRGGMAKALAEGFPQSEVEAVASRREAGAARRKDVILGTNMYPNLTEDILKPAAVDPSGLRASRANAVKASGNQAVLGTLTTARTVEAAIQAASQGATLGELTAALRAGSGEGPTVKALRLCRASEMFEELREASEFYLTRSGARPRVFLANMGPVAQHKARADFATGFFQVAGFEVLNNKGFETPEQAAEAAAASGAPVAVICSTDDTYPELVPAFVKALRARKPDVTVILAGYPEDQIQAHREAGVNDFIHIRANVHEMLATIMKQIGVLS